MAPHPSSASKSQTVQVYLILEKLECEYVIMGEILLFSKNDLILNEIRFAQKL